MQWCPCLAAGLNHWWLSIPADACHPLQQPLNGERRRSRVFTGLSAASQFTCFALTPERQPPIILCSQPFLDEEVSHDAFPKRI